jgi:hypothetical protein
MRVSMVRFDSELNMRWLPIPIVLLLAACGTNTPPATNSGGNASAPVAPAPTNAKAPDENAALDAIAKINEAQSSYFKRNRRYALTLDELVDAHLIKGVPTTAEMGYDFTVRPAADAQTYKMTANPVAASSPARHFFTDQSGTVHAETGKDATADSPKI